MRQSRNLSGGNSATGQTGHRHANGSAASADEENIPSPLRRASGKRRSRPFSGEFDYDAINHPLPKSPVSKKEGGIVSHMSQICLNISILNDILSMRASEYFPKTREIYI